MFVFKQLFMFFKMCCSITMVKYFMIQAPSCSSYSDAQSFAAIFLEAGVKKERKREIKRGKR